MSSLPPPGYTPRYTFWPLYLTPPDSLLAPARRASLGLFGLGVLLLIVGTCAVVSVMGTPDAVWQDVMAQAVRAGQAPPPPEVTPALLRIVMAFTAGGVGAFGLVLIGAGLAARSGVAGGLVFGIVTVILPAIALVLMIVVGLLTNPVAGASLVVIVALPLALMGLTLRLLIDALGHAGAVASARRQLRTQREHYARLYGTGELPVTYEPPPPTPPTTPGPPPIP